MKQHETKFDSPVEDISSFLNFEWPKNVLAFMLTPRPRQSILGTLTRSRTTLYVPSARDSLISASSGSRRRSISPDSVRSEEISDEVFLRHKPSRDAPKSFTRSRLSLFSGTATVDAKKTVPIMAFEEEYPNKDYRLSDNKEAKRPKTEVIKAYDDTNKNQNEKLTSTVISVNENTSTEDSTGSVSSRRSTIKSVNSEGDSFVEGPSVIMLTSSEANNSKWGQTRNTTKIDISKSNVKDRHDVDDSAA